MGYAKYGVSCLLPWSQLSSVGSGSKVCLLFYWLIFIFIVLVPLDFTLHPVHMTTQLDYGVVTHCTLSEYLQVTLLE